MNHRYVRHKGIIPSNISSMLVFFCVFVSCFWELRKERCVWTVQCVALPSRPYIHRHKSATLKWTKHNYPTRELVSAPTHTKTPQNNSLYISHCTFPKKGTSGCAPFFRAVSTHKRKSQCFSAVSHAPGFSRAPHTEHKRAKNKKERKEI